MSKRRFFAIGSSVVCICTLLVVYLYYAQRSEVLLRSCGHEPGMVRVPGGTFIMGAGAVYPDEGPEHTRTVSDFLISRYEVTNAEFQAFVDATGYITMAERQPDPAHYPNMPPEMLIPGSAVFVSMQEAITSSNMLNWWKFVEGASWLRPNGAGSSIDGKEHFPVIHIALEDAKAYAQWKGHRLPTEAEYEYASRGGLDGAQYATGDSLKLHGEYQGNTWQGLFPMTNSADDGHSGLAPVGCYPANGYGIHDMIGNVWEWTQTPYYVSSNPLKVSARERERYGHDERQPGVPVGVIKGGSYLCAEDFCMRYRPAARHSQDTGMGSSNIGFRTVQDIPSNG